MSDRTDELKRAQIVQSSPKRRGILRGLAAGVASVVGFGGITSAKQTDERKRTPAEVESVNFEMDSAFGKLQDVIGSPLFRELVSEGYLSEQSVEEFPSYRLANDSQLGGVEWLRINGELEQVNFHKPVDGKQLEINLPLSDMEPNAIIHDKDGESKIYNFDNNFKGQNINETNTNSSVGTYAQCDGHRFCATCIACCGLDNWARDSIQVECPNCWATDCKWVKVGCC